MREAKRRKMGYWEPFNVWWREYVAQHDKRPKVHEMKKWYETNAERVWGGTGPTWDETKKHSKGMRRIEDISDYFRQYRRGRRKKAAGCSVDSETTDSDVEELGERASTPDSDKQPRNQVKGARKAPPGAAGARNRGRPKQENADLTGTSMDQPTISGCSAKFPHSLSQPLGSGMPQSEGHAPAPVTNGLLGLPRENSDNLLQKQQLLHIQHQQHQPYRPQFQHEAQPLQLNALCGEAQFPVAPAHQQRTGSSSLLLGMPQLRSVSTSQIPSVQQLRTSTTSLMPSDPASAPQQQQLIMGMVPMPPTAYQQQSQEHLHQHMQLDEPEQMHKQQDHPHHHYNSYRQEMPPPQDNYVDAASPQDSHSSQVYYPKIFGLPVPGLPFFGGWRSRSAGMPPNPPHGHGGHAPQPYPGHPTATAAAVAAAGPAAPPAPIQRSLAMPRAWSQPPAPPQPPPLQRRMGSWGMVRMLSAPRAISAQAQVSQQMPPPPSTVQHPQQHHQQQSQPLRLPQPQPQSQVVPRTLTSQMPMAMRAGSAILNGFAPFMRGSLSPSPASMSQQPEPYMDPSAAPPPDLYMSTSPPETVPQQSYMNASSPQAQVRDQSMSPQDHCMAVVPNGPYTNGPSQPPPSETYMAAGPQFNNNLHNPHTIQQAQPQPAQPQLQSQLGLQAATLMPPPAAVPVQPPGAAAAAEPQQPPQALLPGPPPDPFRTRERVLSLTRHFDLPIGPHVQSQLHMDEQDAGPTLHDGQAPAHGDYVPPSFGNGASAGVNPDLATIVENRCSEVQAAIGGSSPAGEAQQTPSERTSSGSGSLFGLFTRGSTMQRLRELFMSWANTESDTQGQDASATPGSGEGDAPGAAAPVLAPPPPPTGFWGRSNSNPRSGSTPKTGPGSPDFGPNPFRQQLQRLGSMSSSWLLGKRSREESSPLTQTSTPTSRKLQRGFSGVFRPIVDMMSFGRRSSNIGASNSTIAAAEAAVAEHELAMAAAAATAAAVAATAALASPAQPDFMMTDDVDASATAVASVGPRPPAVVGDVDAATEVLPELGQVMSCMTDVDGDRLLLEGLDSHILAALDEETQAGRQPLPPVDDTNLSAGIGVGIANGALAQPLAPPAAASQPQQLPHEAMAPPAVTIITPTGALITSTSPTTMDITPSPVHARGPTAMLSLTAMEATPPPAAAMGPTAMLQPSSAGHQVSGGSNGAIPYLTTQQAMPPPPPSGPNGLITGPPVITTGARPAAVIRPQLPYGNYGQVQPQIIQQQLQLPPDGQMSSPGSSLWLSAEQQQQQQKQDLSHLGCDGLEQHDPLLHNHPEGQQQHHHHAQDEGHGGGMLLRLSNSLTEYLKQMVWGQGR